MFLQKCYPSILTLSEQGASTIAIIDLFGIGRPLTVITICNILLALELYNHVWIPGDTNNSNCLCIGRTFESGGGGDFMHMCFCEYDSITHYKR